MTETVAEQNLESGKICRVSGPIVEAEGMERAMMYEVVEVGPDGLIGEVIKVSGGRATIQVYEHTGGLEPGMEVKRKGRPLSLQLGPGMLGGIYDGIQHPLGTFREKWGPFITRGAKAFPLDQAKEWEFEPNVEEGDNVEEGQIFGTVQETESIEHRLMVPPGCVGKVSQIREAGSYTVEEIVCVVETEAGKEQELDMVQVWPCREARPFGERLRPTEPLITGQRVLDTMFPIVRGGSAAVPGDFGTGKTVVQQQLAKWSDADVVIYVGCGERGNEMTDILRVFPDLQDPRTGRSLMERTVLIANTSNMPVAAREISIYSGVTVAEYFRDMGYDVALMADSTSRWAEALREVSSRLEEMPAEEGFPAYLSKRLAEFYERAGFVETLGGDKGSVTVVGSVSPPAGDFSEPVTQHTKRFVRCFWVLDRDLAYARHFPAVNWDQSYSEYVDEIADWWGKIESDWASLRRDGINLLQEYDRLQEIVKLVGRDVLPDEQRLILLCAETLKRGFLQQDAFNDVDSFCDPKRQAAFLRAIMTFYRRAKEIISAGAPIMRLQELDVVGELQRARFHIENEDEEGLQELNDKVRKQLDELEANYQ
ncbi:MAG: V-type ATP synthase subunit A [Planctomycetes bacterium]|nr:V-type ATP synthase subunit A [Planctomycetota bacterium]